jgi:hypothetical protein
MADTEQQPATASTVEVEAKESGSQGQDASHQLQQDVVETGAAIKQEAEHTGRR